MGERFLMVNIDPECLARPRLEDDMSCEQHGFFHLNAGDVPSPDLNDLMVFEFLYHAGAYIHRGAKEFVDDEGSKRNPIGSRCIVLRVMNHK